MNNADCAQLRATTEKEAIRKNTKRVDQDEPQMEPTLGNLIGLN